MKLPAFFNRFKRPTSAHPQRALGVTMTPSGTRVDHDTAMTYHALWACVLCVSQTLGVLNMHLFQRQVSGGNKRRDDLVLNDVLRRRPNSYMTAMTFREVLTGHALTWGNGYAEIERDNANRPIALWPILPNQLRPVISEDNELWYEYFGKTGERVYLPKEDILHLKGFGFDGLIGYDVISYFCNTVGHAIAIETFSSSYFGNGTHLSGGLFSKKRLSKEARESLRQEFVDAYAGPRKAFRMGVFEEGMEWRPFGLSPEASKLIESRMISVEDIARIFRVPLHKIGHLLRATNNNIEHQGIEYVVDTILPWATRWEQECDLKLLSRQMQRDHFTKLNVATLMRGDMKSRYDAYKIGREWGWLNANQIAELEDMEPIGPAGDVYIIPMNYQPLDAMLNPPEPTPPSGGTSPNESSDDTEDSSEPSNVARGEIMHAMNRIFRREAGAMKEALKAEDKEKAFKTFERTHAQYASDALIPFSRIYFAIAGKRPEDCETVVNAWCQNLARIRADLWRQGPLDIDFTEAFRLTKSHIDDFTKLIAAAAGASANKESVR